MDFEKKGDGVSTSQQVIRTEWTKSIELSSDFHELCPLSQSYGV